jgi:hypothetical protein
VTQNRFSAFVGRVAILPLDISLFLSLLFGFPSNHLYPVSLTLVALPPPSPQLIIILEDTQIVTKSLIASSTK